MTTVKVKQDRLAYMEFCACSYNEANKLATPHKNIFSRHVLIRLSLSEETSTVAEAQNPL